MENENDKEGPRGFTVALIVAIGVIWVGIAASANATGHVMLLGLTIVAGAMVLVLRRSWRPVFALGLALYALALAVLIHFATRASWLRPLVVKPCQDFAGFGIDPSVVHCLVALPVLVIAGFAAFGVARILVQRESFLVPVIRLASIVLLGISMTSLVWAIPQTAQKPAPEHYIESLPVLGTVLPPAGKPSRSIEQKVSMPSSMPMIHNVNVYEFQLTSDIVVRRYCKGPENCKFMLRASDSPATADDQKFSRSSWVDTATMDPLHCVAGDIQIDDAAPIVIREDAAHGLLFASGTQVHAVEAKTFQFRAVSSQDILAATSSARGFIIAAMAGIVAALILEIFRFRARSRLRRIANAPTGMLAADGWVVFDDGSPPIRMGIDSEVSSGPVIVMPLDSPIAAGGPYRGIVYADKLEVLSGERKEVLRRERWALQSPFDAFAIAVLLLAATPLATFWYGQWISS